MVAPGQVRAVVPGSVLKHRYRLDGRIAAGGMGEVWRGTDLALQRVVAVKLLRPEYAQDEVCLARFRAEGRHAALLSHPNIAQVYDYFDKEPAVPGFLVLELVEGQSLARLLDAGPLDPAQTMGIIAQAAAGLQAAHAAGLVHRDIKPGNLLVDRDDHIKITDFGVAQVAGSARLTLTGALVGTAAYLAPERAAGALATPAGDLYALGVVAYHCLTGKVPFDGELLAVAWAHVQQAMPPLPPSVPAEVAALVADLTAKDPSARPPSAGDVAVRAERLRAAPSPPPAAAPGSRMLAAGMLPARTGAAPRMRPMLSGRPPGRGSGGGARRRWQQRLARASVPVRVALVIAGLAVASLGWVLATTHGSAPDHLQSPSTRPASPQASPRGAAGPRPVASPGASSAGDASHASSHARRRGRSSPASSAPSPTPTPSLPQPTPSLPLPTPSLPLPTPSLPLPPGGIPPPG